MLPLLLSCVEQILDCPATVSGTSAVWAACTGRCIPPASDEKFSPSEGDLKGFFAVEQLASDDATDA